jgi:hypothetical protein
VPDGNGGDANALEDWKAFGVNAGDEGTDAQVEKPQLALGERPMIGVCAALSTALVANSDGNDVSRETAANAGLSEGEGVWIGTAQSEWRDGGRRTLGAAAPTDAST